MSKNTGVGMNPHSYEGAPKGAVEPNERTRELLEAQKDNFIDPNNPLASLLARGKKVREIVPEGGDNK